MLGLQRTIGNQAVASLVQRLVYHTNPATLYASPTWAATQVTLLTHGKNSINNHLTAPGAKAELLQGINGTLQLNAQELTVTDSVDTMNVGLDAQDKTQRKARQRLYKALNARVQLLTFDTGDLASPFKLTQNTRMILGPEYLIPEANDLGTSHVQSFVCSLIALIKAEGLERVISWLKAKGEQYKPRPETKSGVLTQLHKYYWVDNHVMYDDDTTHPRLYSEWGYSLIYSGRTSWEALLGRGDILKPGRKYIFDIDGHTVYTTVLRDLRQLQGNETLSTYFSPQSDADNWDKSAAATMAIKVHAIFSK